MNHTLSSKDQVQLTIEVRGGNVVDVTSNGPARVDIVDWDNSSSDTIVFAEQGEVSKHETLHGITREIEVPPSRSDG